MKIHPIIFNWASYGYHSLLLEGKLYLSGYKNTSIVNSSNEFTPEHWHNVGNNSYYTAQFKKALEIFDGDIMLLIQADTKFDLTEKLIQEALDDYSQYNWGVYSPNIDYSAWTSMRTNIKSLENNRNIVACTDCTYWFIHKDVIGEFIKLNSYLNTNTLGFGIDILICALSHMMNKPVIRNYNYTVHHPKSTNYNTSKAMIEMYMLFNKLPREIRMMCNATLYKSKSLQEIYTHIN